jgi:hypothetical protein
MKSAAALVRPGRPKTKKASITNDRDGRRYKQVGENKNQLVIDADCLLLI